MIVNEKALVKAMEKAAASGGYRVRFDPEHAEIAVYADEWFVKVDMEKAPRKIIGMLAEHFGYLPDEGCFEVQKTKDDPTAVIQGFAEGVFLGTQHDFCQGLRRKAGWLPATAWGLALAMDLNRKLYTVRPALVELEVGDNILALPEMSALCWGDDDSFLAVTASTASDFDGCKADILAALERIEWSVDSSGDGRAAADNDGQMEIGDDDEDGGERDE